MLTGDKLETAENIGYSCSLVQKNFHKFYIRAKSDYARKADDLAGWLDKREQGDEAHQQKICVLIEGSALLELEQMPETEKKIVVDGLSRSDSVICCRMNPKQKGKIVKMVKEYINKITLGIGDGANDVNMIQEADIGIGLYGKEGLRAVQASDYALVEFKALWKLLFVHGRWSYIRISEMIMYFYYKNLVFAVPQFFYLFYNAFSSQTLFEDFYISFFNLIFTSWPVIIRAVFDQDIYYKKWTSKGPMERLKASKTLAFRANLQTRFNYLYYVGQKNLLFNMKNIFLWFFNSIMGALIIFYLTKECYASDVINAKGQVQDIWFLSIIMYTVIIFVVDLKLLMFTKHFNVFIFVSVILFSIVLYVAYFFIADLISVFLIYKTAMAIVSSGYFYLILLLVLGLLFMIDLFILTLDREVNTPLYILFKSLIMKKKPVNEEKNDFEEITRQANEKAEENN